MASQIKSIIEKAKQLNIRFEHGNIVRFKDGCNLTIFNRQVVLWGTNSNVVAWVDISTERAQGESITLKDFLTYLDDALED